MGRSFLSRQFMKFLFASGAAAVVNFLGRILYNEVFSFGLAVILAYLTGMITAFLLVRVFVFDGSGRKMGDEFGLYALVNLVAIGLIWGVSIGLAEYLFPIVGFEWHRYEVAHAVGIMVPAFSSYLGHKHMTFLPVSS